MSWWAPVQRSESGVRGFGEGRERDRGHLALINNAFVYAAE